MKDIYGSEGEGERHRKGGKKGEWETERKKGGKGREPILVSEFGKSSNLPS